MLLVAVYLAVLPVAASAANAELRGALRAEVERLRESGRLSVGGIRIGAVDLIPDIYERRDFEPGWAQPERIESLLAAVRASDRDGLRPADYHLERIEERLETVAAGVALSPIGQAAFDLMMTDGLVRLTYHHLFGKANPEFPGPPWSDPDGLDDTNAAAVIDALMDADSIPARLAFTVRHGPYYQRLLAQLQRHRTLAASGGWPALPDGPSIRPGSADGRLATLVARLAMSGDLPSDTVVATVYDEPLQRAVRRFQKRHGLEADAIVGPATRRAMNVPIAARIDQIRVNLERGRWVRPRDDFVLVNIPAFKAALVRDGQTEWVTRVIVGETEAQTPLIQSTMKNVVLNPTWTVPHSIASEEILPRIRTDPGYLNRGHFDLLDSAGNAVAPTDVDWSAVTADSFRFTLVQRPGPWNELGRIKFMFPNDYAVCMHDTPGKGLFERATRALSHGCIRVDEPLELAARLLDHEGWTRQDIRAQIETVETKTVPLSEPLPILLVYRTAEVDDRGTIHFYEDIYERDGAVLVALDRPLD